MKELKQGARKNSQIKFTNSFKAYNDFQNIAVTL